MKKKILLGTFLILGLLLGGCGSKGDSQSSAEGPANSGNAELPESITENIEEEEGYYDVKVEETKLSLNLAKGEFVMGAQYEGEEIVFLIGNKEGDVYSYRQGQEKELLLEGISSSYVCDPAKWWKLGDKYYIAFDRFFTVLNQDGSFCSRASLKSQERISGVCQTENGSVLVIHYSNENYVTSLMELNPLTGELTSKLTLVNNYGIAGGAGDGVMLRESSGIYTYDLKSGEKTWHMKFGNTAYDPLMTQKEAIDFRLTPEGNVLILSQDFYNSDLYEESLTKVSLEGLGKTILVFKLNSSSSKMKELVAQFNKENETYYVYLDTRDYNVAYNDYTAQTNIELATGKAADIIGVDCVSDIASVAMKGTFENLESYMEKSGMKREDYFPVAFQDLETGEGCYAIGYSQDLENIYMKEELAKDVGSLEDLLKNMENYEEDAVFSKGYQRYPWMLLDYYLHMSEDLHGMLDWENGTCDFSGELWESILENCLRYGNGQERPYSEEITTSISGSDFSIYVMGDMAARKSGMVPLGFPAGDDFVPRVYVNSICMNAASENKEGVWEFMEFLLSAQIQQKLSGMYTLPTLKSEFENACRKEIANPGIVGQAEDYMPVYVTEEQVEQLKQLLEEARPWPLRTEYILAIVEEEAEYYFAGEKTIGQVSEIINNRVGLYMAENY